MAMLLKSATMFKLGDGPVNYDWNLRFFVLNYQSQELTYFGSEEDQTPRGIIPLADALISNITLIKEREHSFSLQCFPQPQGKIYFFSCNSFEESEDWQSCFIKASKLHKELIEHDQQMVDDSFIQEHHLKEPSYYEQFDERALLEESDKDSDGFIGLDQIKARMTQGIASHFVGNKSFKSSFKKRPPSRMGGVSDKKSEAYDIHDKSTLVEAGDQLEVAIDKQPSKETIENMKLIETLLIDKTSEWKTFKIDNGIEFQAVKPRQSNIAFDKKSFKSFIKLFAVLALVEYMVSSIIQPFFTGVVTAMVLVRGLTKGVSFQPKLSKIRGRILIKGTYDEVAPMILECYNQFKLGNTKNNTQENLVVFPLSNTHCMVYIFSSMQKLDSLPLLQKIYLDSRAMERVSLILSSVKEIVTISKINKAHLDVSMTLNDKSVVKSESGDDEDTEEHSQFQ